MPADPRHPPLAVRAWWLQRWFRRGDDEKAGRERKASARPRNDSGLPLDLDALENMLNNRVRRMMSHTWLVAFLMIFVLAAGIGATIFFTVKPTAMKIAVGPSDSDDARLVAKLTEKFQRDHAGIRLTPIIKDRPVEAKDIGGKLDYDLAVVSSPGMSPDWPVVAILRKNVMALIVPARETATGKRDAKKGKTAPAIKSVTDLAGRRVGILARTEASPDLLHIVLNHYGVPTDKVEIINVEPKDLAVAVRDHWFDALLVVGPATSKALTTAVTATTVKNQGPSFIAIDQADGISERTPAFEKVEIDAGTFGGSPPQPADSLTTLAFPEYIVARKSLSEDTIASFAKLLYSSRQTLRYELPGAVKIESPSTDKDSDAIVHPGAAAYLGDSQKSFFDRHGDQIFYGMLIIPALGSGIAAVASWFRADTRNRRTRMLHRLLQALKKARNAESLETLDRLEADIDSIMAGAIQQAERDQLDETGLMSFSLGIQQARHAVAERRRALAAKPEATAKPETPAQESPSKPGPRPVSSAIG
jgi:hypothetical protein